MLVRYYYKTPYYEGYCSQPTSGFEHIVQFHHPGDDEDVSCMDEENEEVTCYDCDLPCNGNSLGDSFAVCLFKIFNNLGCIIGNNLDNVELMIDNEAEMVRIYFKNKSEAEELISLWKLKEY